MDGILTFFHNPQPLSQTLHQQIWVYYQDIKFRYHLISK